MMNTNERSTSRCVFTPALALVYRLIVQDLSVEK